MSGAFLVAAVSGSYESLGLALHLILPGCDSPVDHFDSFIGVEIEDETFAHKFTFRFRMGLRRDVSGVSQCRKEDDQQDSVVL